MKKLLSIVIISVLTAMIIMSGCGVLNGKKDPLVGSYRGSSGGELTLQSDGKCLYLNKAWLRTEKGTWKVEDEILVLYDVADHELTADISEFSETQSFVLTGDGREEYKKKTTLD